MLCCGFVFNGVFNALCFFVLCFLCMIFVVTCAVYGVCCAALLCVVCFVMLYSILRLYIIVWFVYCAV